MKALSVASMVVVLWGVGPLAAQTPTAAQWLARLDRNQTSTSGHSVGILTVEDRFGAKATGFEAWTSGADRSLTVFTSGEEKGQKILRLKDTLYVAYPEADKPVKIQGAALKDSVAGSDFSYEDMAGDRSLVGRYEALIVGEEAVAGESCTILELRAKKPGLAYPRMRVWVADDGAGRKIEKYSLNGRLLKTQEVLETRKAGNRTVASKVLMTDALKTRSKTLLTLSETEVDIPVDPVKFSLEELTW